jgi:hypothetical protein
MTFESMPLTQGNLDNNHIYITPFRDQLPPDVIGGSNRQSPAARLMRLEFEGRHVDTYIPTTEAGTPRSFFQARSFVRELFERTGAEPGDSVLFDQVSAYHLRVSLKKSAPDETDDPTTGASLLHRRFASPREYGEFFSAAASEQELALLKAHALGGEMSMGELAPSIGGDGFRGANSHYGRLGARLAAELGLSAVSLEGQPVKYSVFADWRDPSLVPPRLEDELSSRKASWRSYLHEATIRGLHLASILDEDELAEALRRLSEVLQSIEHARNAIASASARVEGQPAPSGDKILNALDPTLLWENSIDEMMKTAKRTVAHSNGQTVERTLKNKDLTMSAQELRDHIQSLIRNQNGFCNLSGVQMQPLGSHRDKPLVASLDRIDSNRHYEKGNLQIVCRFVNRWKSDTPDAEFRRLVALVQAVDRG